MIKLCESSIIDTNKFSRYELQWNYNAPVSEYRFSNQKDENGDLLYPELVIENYNKHYPLIGIGGRDTISTWHFNIDSWLFPSAYTPPMKDSTVDIIVKILLFTQNDVDTLTLMGRYTYGDNPNSIKIKYVENSQHTNPLNYSSQYGNRYFYNCLGRKITIGSLNNSNFIKLSNGIYLTPGRVARVK